MTVGQKESRTVSKACLFPLLHHNKMNSRNVKSEILVPVESCSSGGSVENSVCYFLYLTHGTDAESVTCCVLL